MENYNIRKVIYRLKNNITFVDYLKVFLYNNSRMKNKETIELIQKTLSKIRPFIQRDGGDVEFIEFKDGIVFVKMHGACEGCVALDQTLKNGIEVILMDEVPGVIGVQLASE